MKTIPLTRGMVAIVDDADYDLVAKYKWYTSKSARNYYAHRHVSADGRRGIVCMHRQILGEPIGIVDHRNGDGLDNRRLNLRHATFLQNSQNRRPNTGKASRFHGVSLGHGHWRAQIRVRQAGEDGEGHRVHLGAFDTEEGAALAYDAAARKHFGEFAALNFPDRASEVPARRIHPLAPKLTEDDVIDMRTCYALGASIGDLARVYGVANQNAWLVVTYRSYRHVGGGRGEERRSA